MKKLSLKKFFTLIELIVVIVVLGILAAIVIPNISSFQDEAKETAILSDARNIQTAVDMFMLDYHGATPTKGKAEFGHPQIIELYAMQPDYLRDTPKQGKFWLDESNTVVFSTVDAPTGVDYREGELTWDTVENAQSYFIYEKETTTLSKTNGNRIKLIQEITPLPDRVQSFNGEEISKDGIYLISAIDKYGYETPAIKTNSSYEGYGEGPEDGFLFEDSKTPPSTTIPSDIEKLELGQFVKFGKHLSGEDMTWNVVKKEKDKVMLFMSEPIKSTHYFYLARSYDEKANEGEPDESRRNTYGSNNWRHSDLRKWLNGEFYENAFANKEIILDTTYDYILSNVDSAERTSGETSHINTKGEPLKALENYGVSYKNTLTDKIFLPNIEELIEIKEVIGSNYYGGYNYWLRDSDPSISYRVRNIDSRGEVNVEGAKNASGRIRAAIYIDSGSFSSGNGSNSNPYIIE